MSSEDEAFEAHIRAELFVSPLRAMVTDLHELHSELVAEGFPTRVATQIIAYMLSDTILDTEPYDPDEDDDDDDNDDIEDDNKDESI